MLTRWTRPMPHSGAVRHSRPEASKSGRPSASPLAHVVEQHIGVGVDGLVGELGERRVGAGGQGRRVARRASRRLEQSFAAADDGIVDIAARGNRQGACIEHQLVEAIIIELGRAAVGRHHAIGLRRRAIVGGEDRGGDPHVTSRRPGDLLVETRRIGFPAEAGRVWLAR